ncbi:MAG: hypothetical protein R3F54_32240, partial [Alphaproteobacteria bacterium]
VVHGLGDMIRFRLMTIAAGYEDGNDASSPRADAAFKLAQDRLPSGRHLASPPIAPHARRRPPISSDCFCMLALIG